MQSCKASSDHPRISHKSLISTTFPALSDIGLGLAYGIYTAAAILSFFFVVRFVSETKGKELEEMRV